MVNGQKQHSSKPEQERVSINSKSKPEVEDSSGEGTSYDQWKLRTEHD